MQAPSDEVSPPGPNPALDDILSWSIEDYRRELRGSAMKRAKLPMLQRNARIAAKTQSNRPSANLGASADGRGR